MYTITICKKNHNIFKNKDKLVKSTKQKTITIFLLRFFIHHTSFHYDTTILFSFSINKLFSCTNKPRIAQKQIELKKPSTSAILPHKIKKINLIEKLHFESKQEITKKKPPLTHARNAKKKPQILSKKQKKYLIIKIPNNQIIQFLLIEHLTVSLQYFQACVPQSSPWNNLIVINNITPYWTFLMSLQIQHFSYVSCDHTHDINVFFFFLYFCCTFKNCHFF